MRGDEKTLSPQTYMPDCQRLIWPFLYCFDKYSIYSYYFDMILLSNLKKIKNYHRITAIIHYQ